MEPETSRPPSPGALLFCLLLLTLGFRIVHLAADPPGDFDWSGGYFADEGYWSHNARNSVLFGAPLQDEWDSRVMSPLFTAAQKAVFQVFGIGLPQVRIIGLLSAVALTLATFFLVRRSRGDGAAFLCAALVSLNYPLLVLARQGILDPFAAAFSWTALVLSCAGGAPAAFLSGLLLVGACTAKFYMIYAFAPVSAMILLSPGPRMRNALAFAAGSAAAAAVWLFLVYFPNREIILAYNRFYASQQAQSWDPVSLAKNVVLQPFYLYAIKSPAILLLGNLLLWRYLARPREAQSVERACWIWLICGILFFAVWRYRPLRYYTSLYVPLAALAGLAFARLEDLGAAMKDSRSRALILLGLAVPALQAALVLVDRFSGMGRIPVELGIHTVDAAVFVLMSLMTAWALLANPARLRWIRVLFVAGFLLCDMRNYTGWMIAPEQSASAISADLQSRLAPGSVLSGQWAPELVLENNLKAVPVWKGFVNSDDPFRKYGITHLLLWRYPLGDEYEKFKEWYPAEMKAFKLVKRYSIKNSDLELYERKDQP